MFSMRATLEHDTARADWMELMGQLKNRAPNRDLAGKTNSKNPASEIPPVRNRNTVLDHVFPHALGAHVLLKVYAHAVILA